nr:selenium cofactor biosynthesis protein YqeC [Chloroflexota bacterium]
MIVNHGISSTLGLQAGDLVSIVGAGGKTTTMYRICNDVRAQGLRVISTTTTAIQRPTPAQSPLLLITNDIRDSLTAIVAGLDEYQHITVVGETKRADKFEGVNATAILAFRDLADVVVAEADGARHAAIK